MIVEPDAEASVEITAPQAVSLERINELLASLGQPPLAAHEFKPVKAA